MQNQENNNAKHTPGPFGHQSPTVYQDLDTEDSDWEEVHCRKPLARKRQPKVSKGKKFLKN